MEATPYDKLSYPGRAYHVTRPDHLATLGTIYGMAPAPPSKCRVLELGCGIGNNLLPMAHQYPGSTFIGIDLSRGEIEKGLSQISALQLANISLRQGDIASMEGETEPFDYIISHGVYSWVPPHARPAMLSFIGRHLASEGIAYVSYNSHPGSHMRDLVRDIMNFHVRGLADPRQRIGQARAILKFVSEGSKKDTVYGGVLREQFERVEKMADEVLYHDDLDEGAQAFLLSQFVADAEQHGLQYLSDANFARRDIVKYPEAVRAVLAGFPDDEFLARDQIQDFLDGHGFRTTLLCRRDIKLERTLTPECIRRYYLASSCRPVDAELEPNADGKAEFKTENGDVLESTHRLTIAALQTLGRYWPAAIAFDDLAKHALAQIDPAHTLYEANAAEKVAEMSAALFKAAQQGCVFLNVEPSAFASDVSERPEASFLVRKQAELGLLITNRRHIGIRLEGEIERQALMLLDGTRDLDQLIADLKKAMRDVPPKPDDKPINRENAELMLRSLANLAVLVH
jgi:SAM-dependent methyltransferase